MKDYVKGFIIGFLTGLIVFVSLDRAFPEELLWGKSRAEIKKFAGGNPIADNKDSVAYMNQLWGHNVMVGYIFEKNKLAQVNFIPIVPIKSKDDMDMLFRYICERSCEMFGFNYTDDGKPITQYKSSYTSSSLEVTIVGLYPADVPVVKVEVRPASEKTKLFFKRLEEKLNELAERAKRGEKIDATAH